MDITQDCRQTISPQKHDNRTTKMAAQVSSLTPWLVNQHKLRDTRTPKDSPMTFLSACCLSSTGAKGGALGASASVILAVTLLGVTPRCVPRLAPQPNVLGSRVHLLRFLSRSSPGPPGGSHLLIGGKSARAGFWLIVWGSADELFFFFLLL